MIKFAAHAYIIECLSNLHVGSGDNNYGVIDKQVQRDAISKHPVIHASGLKGALREYFEECVSTSDTKVVEIFGSDKNDRENMQQGAFRFFEARLLSFPLRGLGIEPFYLATSEEVIKLFNTTAQSLSMSGFEPMSVARKNGSIVQTEYGSLPLCNASEATGNPMVMADEKVMNEALTNLPIIARNSLDNGQSENLWYEEVVPRESRFYFFVIVPENTSIDFERDFNRHVDGKTVQIGANATVGYGYCKISKIVMP
jgi:CRISPR-associated protein Cmr4